MATPALDQQEDDDEMQIPHPDDDFDAPVVDDRPSFTWAVENSKIPNEYMVSDIFNVAGYKWQIFIFPKGNNIPSHLSIYLDVVHPQTLPYGWRRGVHLGFTVVDQNNRESSFRKETQHQFNARESVWGFTDFMLVDKLHDPSSGFLIDDFFIVEADVKVLDYWSHDSKKETGYVGLKNQGVTCYMNSLLQMLYNIPYFRKAVYHMPITENDVPFRSIPLALQTIFYSLQYSDISVPTEQLTVSFGLDLHSFVKHDVQEFSRFLCEKLEEIMKGTVVEGTIQQLFEGHFVTNIECINVDYKSTSKQSFYDLQLDVKGCRDVYASFDKYVEVEYLDYKYDTEDYGLQDVRKGYLFIDFPPVLQLQLNRFEYDFVQGTMVKVNDRYEFPLQLDLDRDSGKYLSLKADRSVRNLYTLYSVLVHSGGVSGGHYYAYIRPNLSNQWFKFDDQRVTKEDMKMAIDEQYGGEEEFPFPHTIPEDNNIPFKFTKISNAYVLVYIRESDKDKIMCDLDEKDIPKHFRTRKELEEAQLCSLMKDACAL